MQLAGGRVEETQFQFGVPAHAHRAVGGAHAVLQVVAQAEGAVLEAGTGQRGARLDSGVEARLHHEQVVVSGLPVDVPRFPLDQVAQHVVRHPRAEASHRPAGLQDGLVEHQRHFIVEARAGRPDLFGERVGVGAVQEWIAQPGLERGRVQACAADMGCMRGGQHRALGIHHEQFGGVGHPGFHFQQISRGEGREGNGQPPGEAGQVFPLPLSPEREDALAGLADAFEGLFHRRVVPPVEETGPGHGEPAGFAEYRQPATFGLAQVHPIAFQGHLHLSVWSHSALGMCNCHAIRKNPWRT